MSTEVLEQMKEYLKGHSLMALATIEADGTPIVSTVTYVNFGATVYFMTNRNSRKFINLEARSAVAYTVDQEYDNWMDIKGIQMQGMASQVMDKALSEKIMGAFVAKYPQVKDLPPNPDMAIVQVEPVKAYFLDSSVTFGHRYELEF